jgi:hypothetical protein
LACPQYANSSCCIWQQSEQLVQNFNLVLSLFGELTTGGYVRRTMSGWEERGVGWGVKGDGCVMMAWCRCPACFYNLANLLCGFTCSPNQGYFITDLHYTPNPVIPTYNMIQGNFKLDRNWVCGVFASCQATAGAVQAGFGDCESLIDALVHSQQSWFHGTDFLIEITDDDPTSFSAPLYSCCSFPVNISDPSQGNMSCPAAACAGMQAGNKCYNGVTPAGASSDLPKDLTDPIHPPLYGFEWQPVVGAIAGAFVVLLLVNFLNSRSHASLPTQSSAAALDESIAHD